MKTIANLFLFTLFWQLTSLTDFEFMNDETFNAKSSVNLIKSQKN